MNPIKVEIIRIFLDFKIVRALSHPAGDRCNFVCCIKHNIDDLDTYKVCAVMTPQVLFE